jgi:hypothetical protein
MFTRKVLGGCSYTLLAPTELRETYTADRTVHRLRAPRARFTGGSATAFGGRRKPSSVPS